MTSLTARPRVAATDREIRGAIDAFAAALEKAGARVARTSALLPDLGAAHGPFASMLSAITSRRAPGEKTDSIPVHEWFGLLDARERVRRQWKALFAEFDIVIAPAFGVIAFPHLNEPDWAKRTFEIDGQPTAYRAQMGWPGVATFPGLPATAMPIAKTAAGLPIGVQAIGPFLEDLTVMEFARLVSQMH